MSVEKVIDFLSRVAQDPALKSRLEQTPSVEEFVAAAKAMGFDITSEDVARAKVAGNMPLPLSDQDLDAVVGAGEPKQCHVTASDLPFPNAPETKNSSCHMNTTHLIYCKKQPSPTEPTEPTNPTPTPQPAPKEPSEPTGGGGKSFF